MTWETLFERATAYDTTLETITDRWPLEDATDGADDA